MSNPTSNFNWQMPTNTDLVTDLPADFEVFGQAVDTSMADLKGGTTGQILSKTTNADMDFTWIANDQGDITGVTATSPLTGGGTSGAITVGIQDASTSQKGSVQLSDSTSTTSSILAATPTAVKAAYDKASTAATTSVAGIVQLSDSTSTTSSVLAATPTAVKSAYDLAALASPAAAAFYAGKNRVLNSNMSVFQRGTSFTGTFATGTGTYTADRWLAYIGAGANTISRQVTGDTTNLPFIQYCIRVARDSGQTSTNVVYFANGFESVNSIPLAGKTVTLSFYARAGANYSSASNALLANVITGTGTDQNVISGFTGGVNAISQTATLTTTWQRFTYSATLATTATQVAVRFDRTPVGTAGANDYYEITGVQLEAGTSTASPYAPNGATYQVELAACQRYFYAINPESSSKPICPVTAYNTAQWEGFIYTPVQMRVAPSATISSGTSYFTTRRTASLMNTLTGFASTVNGIAIFGTTSGITAGQSDLLTTNSTSANLTFNSEL